MLKRYNPVQIIHRGRKWNATCHLDGKRVKVESAYGSAMSDLRRPTAETALREAERLLQDIVVAWERTRTPANA